MDRLFIGVDWAEQEHVVWIGDAAGNEVRLIRIEESTEGFSELGRWLDEQRAAGAEIFAGIERPDGRMVEFLLGHGVVVYALNPKAVDRARDRYRASGSKSDPFDAQVIGHFVRTDHQQLHALKPNTEQAEELKLLTRDHRGLVRQQTRVLNQLARLLKEYYPMALELFADLTTKTARDFLLKFPDPQKAHKMRRHSWDAFVREHRMPRKDAAARWEKISQKPLAIPDHVIRTRSRRLRPLVAELNVLVDAVSEYDEEIRSFFARTPTARLTETLPVGGDGVLIASVFAEMGDAPGRWESIAHLQAQAGVVPVTQRSGKRSGPVVFRTACNKRLRYALTQYAFTSLRGCDWAAAYYKRQRARGHEHNRALRALAGKWAKIFFVLWQRRVPYDDNLHLATIARQQFIHATST